MGHRPEEGALGCLEESLWYPDDSDKTASISAIAPRTTAGLARSSSTTSGFFLLGIIDDPVVYWGGSFTKANSAVV